MNRSWRSVDALKGKEVFHQLNSLGFLHVNNTPLSQSKGLIDRALKSSISILSSADVSTAKYFQTTGRGIYQFSHGTCPESDQITAFRMGNDRASPLELRRAYLEEHGLLEFAKESPENSLVNPWPEDNEEFRETMLEYYQKCTETCEELLRTISTEIGVDERVLLDLHDKNDHILECKLYPSTSPDLGKRFNEHCDLSTLTILVQDVCAGLQIHVNGEWQTVPFSQDNSSSILVNSGDFLERLSDGQCLSTWHRVYGATPRPRCSIAFFYTPNWDAQISKNEDGSIVYAGDSMPFEI